MMAFETCPTTGAKFVVTIIVNGKPLREFSEAGQRGVRVPFGSEYIVRIKSKYDKRALAQVTIDGTEVLTGGKRLVIPANGTVNLERFVDSTTEGRKFKFISIEEGERTGAIQDPTSPENGLIRVQVYPEKKLEMDWIVSSCSAGTVGVLRSKGMSGQSAGGQSWGAGLAGGQHTNSSSKISYSSLESARTPTGDMPSIFHISDSKRDMGATAEGSVSNQQFRMDNSHWDVESIPVTFDIWVKGPRSETPKEDLPVRIVFRNSNYQVYLQGKFLEGVTSCSITDGHVSIHARNGLSIHTDKYVVAYE